jgi:hypothetical protein
MGMNVVKVFTSINETHQKLFLKKGVGNMKE